jgi:large subunit ribosomal protein L29
MKNTSEIREMTSQEIDERIDENVLMLTRLRLNHTVSDLDNPMKMNLLKKEIARLKTEQRKRELEAQ